MTLDVERLHHVIERYITREYLTIQAPRAVGVTTSFEQLLLAEAQLADGGSHFVYVAINENAAKHMQDRFVRLLNSEPGMIIDRYQHQQLRIRGSGMVFFFVGVEYFSQRFAFLGTKVDKVFVDVVGDLPITYYKPLCDKLLMMQARGTEIV